MDSVTSGKGWGGGFRALVTVVLFWAGLSVCPYYASAQQTYLKGNVCDSLSLAPLPGVVVELEDSFGRSVHYTTSGIEGDFIFNSIPYGAYLLRFSMLGYLPLEVKINAGDNNAGTLFMKADAMVIEAAVHSEQAIRTSQNGDTLIYSAAAYRTMMGASSEDMIAKMPGISVSSSQVEANGKKVSKVMVDGREYFGDDVMTALKNIPADLISEVEVLNKMSDEAEMTSISDGNDYTAINIVTKKGARDRMMAGRLYGGYGIPDKYIVGGSGNYFGKESSLTVLAMANNISRYNFVSEDLVSASSSGAGESGGSFSVKPLAGVSSVQSAGLNYSDRWFNGSYMFNRIDNRNVADNVRRRVLSGTSHQLTTTQTDFNAENSTHKFTAKITPLPKGNHSLILRPTISFQDMYDVRVQRIGLRDISEDEGAIDTLFRRNRLTDGDNDRWNINARLSAVYRYRFSRPGRNISVSLGGSYYRNSGLEHSAQYSFNKEETGFDIPSASSYSRQYRDRKTVNYGANAGLTYTEPLTRRSRMAFDYKFSYQGSIGDNLTYLFDRKADAFLEDADMRQSAVSRNVFMTNVLGARYNYGYRKMTVTASLSYQHVDYSGKSRMPLEYTSERDFDNLLYSLVANLPFNPENSLRIEARSRTQNPSVNMMQTAVNLNNPAYVRSGNPDIVPSYLHSVEARYIHTDRKRGETISVSLNFSGSGNYLSDSLVVDSPGFEVADGVPLGDGNQFSKPVNLPGYYRLSGKFTYGFPVRFLSSNLNVDASAMVSSIPGMINADVVPVHRNAFSAGMRLDSNISENIDFTLSYNARYTSNEFSGRNGVNRNNYFTQNALGRAKWIFWKGFVLTGSVHFQQNLNVDGLYNDRLVYCDVFIGKKLFRNSLGEVNVGVNDLFNGTRRNYRHTINSNGTSDNTDIGLGRYFSVQFVYHLRH